MTKTKQIEAATYHILSLLEGVRDAGGYLEFRSFDERDAGDDKRGKSVYLPVDSDAAGIEDIAKWAQAESNRGRGVFVGMNPRVREGGTKRDVEKYTTYYLDLDYYKSGVSREEALAEIADAMPIPPNVITNSGGGLQVIFFGKPTDDYDKWRDVQTALQAKFAHLGADRAVVTDSSRVLRLTPFANWKYDKESGGRGTSIEQYTQRELTPSVDTMIDLFDVRRARDDGKSSKLPDEMVEGGTATLEGRNTLLFKEAARLRDRGYELDEMIPALLAINERRCVPPMPDSEVERIAQSATRYEPTASLGTSEQYKVGRFGYKFRDFLQAEFPPIEWLIYGLNTGEIALFNALPNAGKTTAALNLSMSMAVGQPYYPLYDGGEPRRVMYLDFENRGAFLQKDVRAMAGNFNPSERELINDNLFVVVDQEVYGAEFNLSNEDHMELVLREAARFQPHLIIIDTLAAAFTLANENDNSEMEKVVIKPLKHIARETGAAIMLIHHIGKAGESGDRSKLYAGRGASALPAAARLVLNLEHLKDGSGRKVENHIVLHAAKVKGMAFEDTVFELDFPRRWFNPANIVLPDETSHQDAIWDIITRPMKRKEIGEALAATGLELSDSTIHRALQLGLATGRLRKGMKLGMYEPNDPKPEDIPIEGEVIEAVPVEVELNSMEAIG